MVREAPFNCVLFGAYESVSGAMKRMDPQNQMIGVNSTSILAGGIAGMCSWATVLPIDFVKSKIQASSNSGKSFGTVFVNEIRGRGLRAMVCAYSH